MTEVYDLVVIGGGTAGIIAAKTAAGLGANVVLVERDRTGGDCLWTGCVPSKALIAAASVAHAMRSGEKFGITAEKPKIDFTAVMAHLHRAIGRIEPADSPASIEAEGATVLRGSAVFTGPGEVRVDDLRLRFGHALVATGSSPALPAVPGLADLHPLTSDTIWDLTELPRRLIVLGGGTIGCELGQAFARLGAEVTIVEATDRLIPGEEPTVSGVLTAALTAEGIRVLTATTATAARRDADGLSLDVRGPREPARLVADHILVATGRRPGTTGLGLAEAGVALDQHGFVKVDTTLRSSNRRIYAAGDVTGKLPFTHVAGMHGSIAATNAVLAPIRKLNHERVPWVTFTDPEIAHIGLTEAQARRRHGDQVRRRVLRHKHVDRAITEDRTEGFTHITLDGKGRVLGASIVAPRAGEMIAELAVLMARGGRLRELGSVVHAYPTWADGVWNAALAEVRDAMGSASVRRAGRAVLHLRRAVSRRYRSDTGGN